MVKKVKASCIRCGIRTWLDEGSAPRDCAVCKSPEAIHSDDNLKRLNPNLYGLIESLGKERE